MNAQLLEIREMNDKSRIFDKFKKYTFLILIIAIFYCSVLFAQDQYSLKPNFYYDKSSSNELIGTYFFPPEKARWDGYEVLNGDWKSLDSYQKYKFITEALQEIEFKETVQVIFDGSKSDLIGLLDKLTSTYTVFGIKEPVITVLLKDLYRTGYIKGELILFAQNQPFLSKHIWTDANKETPEVEIGKTYVGYICCYKKGNEWLPDSEGPVIGEIKRRFFYAKRITVPSGATLLSGNYPLNFEYKIIAFREINSFVDDYGLGNYYYKVIFEAAREVF